MELISRLWQRIHQFQTRYLDLSSLQFRLTIEVVALSILSLGSVAIWTSWKMQQILIVTHTQSVEYIANRFPHDVELYSEMLSLETGLQKTINNVSVPGLLIWVKDLNGKLLAESLDFNNSSIATAELMSLAEMPISPQVYQVSNHYLILCQSSLIIKGKLLGKVYMSQDVTDEQHQLIAALEGLTIVCILVIVVMMGAITLRIQKSLQPLQDMSHLAGTISAEELREAKLQLSHAPKEVKELAQTFNMMLSRLSDSWENQRQFVSNVSHELRTPLTVVSGYLQSLLRRSNNLNNYQIEALETAASEAERTIRLLQDLLELARADSGYIHFYSEPIILNDLLMELGGMAERFSNRTIIIEANNKIVAIADRDRLKQVLINLMDNAIKYSESDQSIILKLDQNHTKAKIQVCDRGIGIPLQDQSRIFERFYRVDEARSRSQGGYGLGLAIVKTLVEAMGGNVMVSSQLGVGSVFSITLPRQI